MIKPQGLLELVRTLLLLVFCLSVVIVVIRLISLWLSLVTPRCHPKQRAHRHFQWWRKLRHGTGSWNCCSRCYIVRRWFWWFCFWQGEGVCCRVAALSFADNFDDDGGGGNIACFWCIWFDGALLFVLLVMMAVAHIDDECVAVDLCYWHWHLWATVPMLIVRRSTWTCIFSW